MFRRKVSVDKDGIMNVEETNTIDRTEKVYELEWNKENLAKLAEGYYSQLDFSTMFYLIDGQRKFKVSQDDFENMSRAGIIAKYHDAYHKKDTSDATKQLTDTIKEAITGSRQEPTPRKKRQKAQAN
jgi:hypothetical protein